MTLYILTELSFSISSLNYSFDVRGRAFSKALYWSDTNAFGPRAYFLTVSRPATLSVDNVQLDDEGVSFGIFMRERKLLFAYQSHMHMQNIRFSLFCHPFAGCSYGENVLQFLICYRCIVVVLIFKILQREIIE